MLWFRKNRLKGDAVMERRQAVLTGDPTQTAPEGVDTSQVWVAAFEVVWPEAAITYVSHPDGTTHAYYSNGRGYQKLDKSSLVADASRAYVALAAQYMGEMDKVTQADHPHQNQVTFWCREGRDTYALTVLEDIVDAGGHPLTRLYRAGMTVSRHVSAAI